MKNVENRLKNIANLLKTADKNLSKANKLMESFISEIENSLDDVPGTLGIFDGINMIDATGKKHEINPNYIAKSLLVIGDNLKMVETEKGEKLFKQVSKVPRKKLVGILNKKEGKWYALTDAGSYRLLDVAVEFRKGEMNEEANVLVPEENLNVEWAALESLVKDEKQEASTDDQGNSITEESSDVENVKEEITKKPIEKVVTKPKPKLPPKKKEDNRPVIKPPMKRKSTKGDRKPTGSFDRKPKEESKGLTAEEVNTLLDSDDLR